MAQDFPVIAETIIVEGRDDTNSIKRAVAAETIETHGFGIRRETWELIDKAYHTTGIIVFTDPDHAGETIRKRILEQYPDALEAFLDQESARAGNDIGIENAAPEAIREALAKVHRAADAASGQSGEGAQPAERFSMEDLQQAGLIGQDNAAQPLRDYPGSVPAGGQRMAPGSRGIRHGTEKGEKTI